MVKISVDSPLGDSIGQKVGNEGRVHEVGAAEIKQGINAAFFESYLADPDGHQPRQHNPANEI
jgi:hypothetical protein